MKCLQFRSVVLVVLLAGMSIGTAHAQQQGHHPPEPASLSTPLLHAPGQAVFGTVQESIQALEDDPNTDWSQVDVDALRRHLIDMHHVAMNVEVVEKQSIENGLNVRVRPMHDRAQAALERVLEAHPHMLKQETGWAMAVERDGDTFVLQTTAETAADIPKIRALGYMGLLAYGDHHQRHHWHMVQGNSPHGGQSTPPD